MEREPRVIQYLQSLESRIMNLEQVVVKLLSALKEGGILVESETGKHSFDDVKHPCVFED